MTHTTDHCTPRLSVVTLVNDDAQYADHRASLDPQHRRGELQWIPIRADERGWGAAEGLNRGWHDARAPWVVFAHQDVRFPFGWWRRALAGITSWPEVPAVTGLVGVRADGRFRGCVDDPHGLCHWGPLPGAVQTIDEHVIIVPREINLRFDAELSGFHGYGADLALEARRRGHAVIAVNAPVRHLSGGRIDTAFGRASEWLLEKWGDEVNNVIPTCAATIARRTPRTLRTRLLAHVNRRRSALARRPTQRRIRRAHVGGRGGERS